MGDPIFTPMLVGAGVGALGGAVTGNNPFKTALLGGALGSGYGALSGATAAAAPATSLAVPTTATEFEAAMGLPSSAFIESGGSLGTALGGRTAAMGIEPISEGMMSGVWDKIKPYATVSNLSGAANIAQQFQPKPRPMISAPSGGVSRGQAPQQSGLILSMDDLMKLSQLQQHKPISLLVR